MMKKVFILIVIGLVFSVCNSTFAGEIKVKINDEKEEQQLEIPYVEEMEDSYDDPYFEKPYHYHDYDIIYGEEMEGLKINGGPMTSIMDLNLTEFNNNLPRGFRKLPGTMILKGVGGLIGSKGGSRFGGYVLNGTVRSIGDDGKKANLELEYGGFLYEHAVYYTDNFDLSFGSLIGGGTARIDLIYNNYQDIDTPNSNSYKKSFMVFEPRITMHYQIAAFVGIDISYGYFVNLNLDDDWEYFDSSVNLPMDTLSSPVTSLKFSVGF